MAKQNGTSAAEFLVEVDGVAAFECTSAEGFGKKHEPFKIPVGGKEMPYIGRGRSEVEEVKLTGAFALTSAGADFHRIFQDYSRGDDVVKKTVTIIQLDEKGKSPIATHICTECAPTLYKPVGNKGDSKEAAMFEIGFLPSDYECQTSG